MRKCAPFGLPCCLASGLAVHTIKCRSEQGKFPIVLCIQMLEGLIFFRTEVANQLHTLGCVIQDTCINIPLDDAE